jgi:hypothetical protein
MVTLSHHRHDHSKALEVEGFGRSEWIHFEEWHDALL